jgi:UDP-sulfoquinovose synthase
VQAVIGHPLTVYGEGGQTRGFLNIRDTLQCVELAVGNPPELGEYRVFNQFTEQFSVLELADLVARSAGQLGYQVDVRKYPNPRVELEQHYYNAQNTKLLDLGLRPHHLGEELVTSMLRIIARHKDRVIERAILPRTRWMPGELEVPEVAALRAPKPR